MFETRKNINIVDAIPMRLIPQFIVIFIAVTFFISCSPGCQITNRTNQLVNRPPFKSEIPIPEGWSSHSYKLSKHPEAFVSSSRDFDDVCIRKTLGSHTSRGFILDAGEDIPFDVYLPEDGTLKFTLGRSQESAPYESDSNLSVTVKGSGDTIILADIALTEAFKGRRGRWSGEFIITIPEGADGNRRITFSLVYSGDERPQPGTFFLAHPTIVAQDDGGSRRRVIWISIDTLRADHLGCYGYERATSPRIDAFAGEGTLFERCISVCPWTFPSYAAMFTGRYPLVSGATTNLRALPDVERTLAEIISARDYATYSVVDSFWVGEKPHLGQGFDTLTAFSVRDAEDILKFARDWLIDHADEDCFLFIHLMDPHLPFVPKEKFRDTFDPEYRGRFRHGTENHDQFELEAMDLTEEEREHIEALYDEEILGCDEDVGDFLDFLKANGLYDGSLVIINSDHGEEFWEHGGFSHGHQLYDELLHIPLIIRGPGFDKGKRVGRMCGGIDVFPTILEWLGLDVPGEINAVSLFDIMSGRVEPEGRFLLSEQLYYGDEQKGVSTDRYRYILHSLDRSDELYDISDDPSMLFDVSADRRSTARKFRYFATEYMLNEGTGWHVRIYRNPDSPGGERYEGIINAPSGFAHFNGLRLNEDDALEFEGDELRFSVSLDEWGYKAIDFTTNDETDEVVFDIRVDDGAGADGLIFLGSEKALAPAAHFSLSILDPKFSLGQPQFGPEVPGSFHGVYIWGNSETLREQITPEIDDHTKAELRALGYLH